MCTAVARAVLYRAQVQASVRELKSEGEMKRASSGNDSANGTPL